MASVRFLLQCGLLALPAHAQLLGQAYPHFELRADPPLPRTQVVAGYLQAGRNSNQSAVIGHRYFYDEAAHTFYGYDIVIQLEPYGTRYDVLYYDLSIGPLDFPDVPADALDPTIWKKLALPALPVAHSIRVNEALENVVSVDPATGQRLIDSMYIMPGSQANSARVGFVSAQQPIQFTPNLRAPVRIAFRGPGVASPDDFAVPTVSGTAREFTIDDAELSIRQARVTVNDVRQPLASPLGLVSGSLVWFYVPQHGRYVLSLLPRPELGFVQAGEVRGGAVSFIIGGDRVQLESPASIVPGDGPYLLYVLHDPSWAPTAQAQSGRLLIGSVSAAELAALSRK